VMNKLFTYSVRQNVRAIYFENISFMKLKEFRFLLRNFKEIPRIIDPLLQARLKSPRLVRLLTPKEEGGLLPTLDDAI